jgi:hypothetical protein
VNLIELDLALTHPMVWVELACGTPPAPRVHTLQAIRLLQPARQASLDEVMTFIEQHQQLYGRGRGCGLVDMVVRASTRITSNARLWTLDKHLANLAERFDVMYQPQMR